MGNKILDFLIQHPKAYKIPLAIVDVVNLVGPAILPIIGENDQNMHNPPAIVEFVDGISMDSGDDEISMNPDMEDDLVSAYSSLEDEGSDEETDMDDDEIFNRISPSDQSPPPLPQSSENNDYDDRYDDLAEQFDPYVSGRNTDKHNPGAVKQNDDDYYYGMGM